MGWVVSPGAAYGGNLAPCACKAYLQSNEHVESLLVPHKMPEHVSSDWSACIVLWKLQMAAFNRRWVCPLCRPGMSSQLRSSCTKLAFVTIVRWRLSAIIPQVMDRRFPQSLPTAQPQRAEWGLLQHRSPLWQKDPPPGTRQPHPETIGAGSRRLCGGGPGQDAASSVSDRLLVQPLISPVF